jgi:thiamine-phosphate pyrophosphorylase
VGLVNGIIRERLSAAHLYAVTPDASPEGIEQLACAYLRGGADIVQLRSKAMARGLLLALAKRLRFHCARVGALLIVNDYLDLALLAGADGVHLGANDLSLAAARRLAGPDLIIGVSASTPQAARQAEQQGADYLGAGPAFRTPVKRDKEPIGLAGVASLTQTVQIPVFAIGGITRTNIPELRASGIDRACVIRALAAASDPEAEAQSLREALTR